MCRCLWACAFACVHGSVRASVRVYVCVAHVKGALSIYVCCHIACVLCLSRSSRMARPPSHSTAHPRNWGRFLHSTISSTFSLRPTPSGLRPSHRCVVNKLFLLFCSWFVQGHTSCFVQNRLVSIFYCSSCSSEDTRGLEFKPSGVELSVIRLL